MSVSAPVITPGRQGYLYWTIEDRILMQKLLFRWLGWCPGALGLILRQKIYPLLLGHCGRNVLFGRYITFYNPAGIHIGDNAVIGDFVSIDARRLEVGASLVRIGAEVFLGTGTKLRSKGKEIDIGKGSSLGSFCRVCSEHRVTIGRNVLAAAFCRFGRVPLGRQNRPPAKGNFTQDQDLAIVVGQGCWLGVRSYLAPGVRIGQGTVIGAHSVVLHSLDEYVVAVGRPAETMYHRQSAEGGGVEK